MEIGDRFLVHGHRATLTHWEEPDYAVFTFDEDDRPPNGQGNVALRCPPVGIVPLPK